MSAHSWTQDRQVSSAVDASHHRLHGNIALRIAMKTIAAGLLFVSALHAQKGALVDDYIKANISAPPAALGLDPFYQKYTSALGIPITSSEKVSDAALLVARDIVIHMLSKRTDVREAMVNTIHTRVAVMATTEMTMDLPEQRNWKKPARDD